MRIIKKTLKVVGLAILGLVVILSITVTLVLNLSPKFGQSPSEEQKLEYAQQGHYQKGKFINQIPTVLEIHWGGLFEKIFTKTPNRRPTKDIVVERVDPALLERPAQQTELIWFGHSAFLLRMDGKNILLDPMLGQYSAPYPGLGPKRYYDQLPIEIEELPYIDAVIFSHDHYDHLDHGSVLRLKDKVGKFYVPLGLGNHLRLWGVPDANIVELNWWDETEFEGIQLVCAPARHFSGRGLMDRNTTLWCSWVIKGDSNSIYFSGDSGYGPHFKKIGDKYGPFDISLMECGQYNVDWQVIHMMPEETAQAALDTKSKAVMPIHWGAFTLAFHDWDDPPIRIIKKALELKVAVATPKIGEVMRVGSASYPKGAWWEEY